MTINFKKTNNQYSYQDLKLKKYDDKSVSEFEQSLLRLVENESNAITDLRVDDRDFPLAPNFLTWCISKKYLHQDPRPFARQFQIGVHLFGEFCPVCSDKKYLREFPLHDTFTDIREHITSLRWGVCPSCHRKKSDLISQHKLNPYVEFAGLVGQRGGKSFLVGSLLSSYLVHRYLKLGNPSKYFALGDTVLHGVYTAINFKQAKETLWDFFSASIRSSPWFVSYHKFLEETGAKLGEKLYHLGEEYLSYRHRNLLIKPTSPDKRALRGRTSFLSSVDEIGWFDNAKDSKLVKLNAKEIHEALGRSFQTLRSKSMRLTEQGDNNVPFPLYANISSPSSRMDMIVELEKRARGSRKSYATHWATWEMNPQITKEDLEQEFKDDPAKAWRDFGAVPPLSGNSFVAKISYFDNVIGKKCNNSIKLRPALYTSNSGQVMTTANLQWIWQDNVVPKLMAIDCGSVSNSFSFVVGHVAPDDQIIYDAVGEIPPNPEQPISFSAVYKEVLLPIVKKMNVALTISDRWQGIKLLQDLEMETGCQIDQYSVKYNDFLMWRENLYTGGFLLPRAEMTWKEIKEEGPNNYPKVFISKPVAHLIFQSLTVVDIPGKTVEKGQSGTSDIQDDIFRSAVLLHSYLSNPETALAFQGLVQKRGLGSKSPIAQVACGTMIGEVAATSRVGALASASSPGLAKEEITGAAISRYPR